MRISFFIFATLAALPISAQLKYEQPYDFIATQDGSALYFSGLVITRLDPQLNDYSTDTKIFRWTKDTGVTLFAERPDLAQTVQGAHLYGTELTYEGTVLYHAESFCYPGSSTQGNHCPAGETQLDIPNLPPIRIGGFLLVSPNGRYGVFAPYKNGASWVDWFTGDQSDVDFQSGLIPNVAQPFYVNQHAVANNGRFLFQTNAETLIVWSKDGEREITSPDTIDSAAISDDGSTVAVTVRSQQGPTDSITYVYDLHTGLRTTFPQSVSLSADGQTVAYLSTDPIAQVFVAKSDGTGARQITNLSESASTVLLSGDARFVFVGIRHSSQIQRYELATGAIDEIAAAP